MNNRERKMVDALKDLRDNHHVVGIKAEFEAEGTRIEEALRLKEVISKAGLGLTMKIGGCEALRDMYEARVIGVERVVAPMVESAYAMQKFLAAAGLAFPEEERREVAFAVNIETVAACENFSSMACLPVFSNLSGIVMGRVDLTGSLGLSREDINTDRVFEITRELFEKAKRAKPAMDCAVGGGVGREAIPFFRRLPSGLLDRYETRKVIFACPAALQDGAEDGIFKAVGFELLWLKNKRDFYGLIFREDDTRIEMLEARYRRLIEEAGGTYA